MIPKMIHTIWISDYIPPNIRGIIDSHEIDGYTHNLIRKDNLPKDNVYIEGCLKSARFQKLSDYLRVYLLIKYGGIYLDADAEVLNGKNFDTLLDSGGFLGMNQMGMVDAAVMGFPPNSDFLKDWLKNIEERHRGDDNDTLHAGIKLLNEMSLRNTKVFEPEYFHPYNSENHTVEITSKTIVFHHNMRSWYK